MTLRYTIPAVLLAVGLLIGGSGGARAQDDGKKLIELGWDIVDPGYMRQNIAQMEKSPFDGTIFFVYYTRPDGKRGNLSREVWSKTALPADAMEPAIDDLKATKFKKFTDNFVRVDTMPADFDWYDDLDPVFENFKLAARIAKEGRAKGLFLDTEQYKGRVFDYLRQDKKGAKSFDQYADQVRKQARRIMDAIEDAYPDVTILLSHGASYTWTRTDRGRKKLAGAGYDLLPAFMSGLVEGARGDTKIVDGFEPSYYFTGREEFDPAYKMIKRDASSLVADKDKYARYVSVGFGLWLDRDWDKRGGWNETDFTKNYYTPDSFEKFVTKALQTSDKYVWIYSQKPNWWKKQNIPSAYADALTSAKKSAKAAP